MLLMRLFCQRDVDSLPAIPIAAQRKFPAVFGAWLCLYSKPQIRVYAVDEGSFGVRK